MSATVVFRLGGRIAPGDCSSLCRRVGLLLEGGDADLVVCDVGAVVAPDVIAIDALSRLQLTARRLGGRVQLYHAGSELRELLALMGLSETLPPYPGLPVEPGREAEEWEETGGVEEEGDPCDPAPRQIEHL
ncbi:MAG: STAS domain-containing protein [Actinobacteria bacterium]|nr:STAS domain-containing protein [Actinomycetota bacterium]